MYHLLVALVALCTFGHLLRSRQARQWARATIRSAAVYANLAKPDHGVLQLQVLYGARRRRVVAVNGVTRLPSAFVVTFATDDRAIVEPVERRFFADIVDVLLSDAEALDWEVEQAPSFVARYSDGATPGFPSVQAVPASLVPSDVTVPFRG